MAGPSATTIKRLFAVSGNQCGFPGCREPLVRNGVLVADVCHIKGKKLGSARYDEHQSEYERHEFDNLIVLCANHHKVVDTDLKTYTVKELRDMKYIHESRGDRFSISDRLAERIALVLSGTAAGVTLAGLAQELAPFVSAIFNVEHSMTLERLPRLLKAAGPGVVAYAYRSERGWRLGEAIVSAFRGERWEVQQLDPQNLQGWGTPEPLLVVVLAHENTLIVDKGIEAVTAYLEELGFKWQSRAERSARGSIRVAIAAFGIITDQ
jgi:hypothetical protein